MARRRKKKNRTRDANDISRRSLRSANYFLSHDIWTPLDEFTRQDILNLDDERTFHPETHRPFRSLRKESSRLTAEVRLPSKSQPAGPRVRGAHFFEPSGVIKVAVPEELSMCERRRRRKEVMFAKRKAGKGGQKRPRWTENSKVNCK